MPATLLSAKIRGVRSYSTNVHKTQTIDFMPLTLIVGANGSGKTTVIECLKFIIAGEEPPLSDSRRNFLHVSKNSTRNLNRDIPCASIELNFLNTNNELCVAKRDILPQGSGKWQTPSILSSYQVGNRSWTQVHRQDDWNKTIPRMFNLPNQALLSNVVLCHQESSLWCMGDSSSVKQIFDKIFGCEQYKKEIKYIDAEIKNCKSEQIMAEKDLLHQKEKVETRKNLNLELQEVGEELNNASKRAEVLEGEIKDMVDAKDSIAKEMVEYENKIKEIDFLRLSLFKAHDKLEQELLQDKSDQTELEDNVAVRRQKLSRKIQDIESLYQNCLHKIKSKEVFVKKLYDQLAKTDPLAKDLDKITENFEKMSSITRQMPETDLVKSLDSLVKETSGIVDGLINKIGHENVSHLKNDIKKEESEIEAAKNQFETMEQEKKELLDEQAQTEAEHIRIRTAAKEAHNKIMSFKNALIEGNYECFEEHQSNVKVQDILGQAREMKKKIALLQKESEDSSQLQQLRTQFRDLEMKVQELRDTRSRIVGSKSLLERNQGRVQRELASLSKVDLKYAESLGKVVCNKIIAEDLEKLKECFKQSVTNFHNQMIAKINEVLRARWRQIYKGPDIDTIELVDEEITKGKDKKAFNYYIAMRKNGLRMKMRETSSAGQRALASIILRMTLAELFVKDFAFIALDEPTANLDLANVESVAKAIASYVKRRMEKGVNIQWIIITHDENFLNAIDAECSPYYYRVELDSDGCSKIVKTSCRDISQRSDEGQA